jgi:hypothetical protein
LPGRARRVSAGYLVRDSDHRVLSVVARAE